MNKKNCPNCAAPYDIQLNKCPYCGTSYFDLSSIDLTLREPFYLKIKTEMNGHDCYLTQLVRPNYEMEVFFEQNDTYAYGGLGNKLISFQKESNLKTNLSFEAIKDKNGNLMTMEVIEE